MQRDVSAENIARAEGQIHRLALAIAEQKRPESSLAIAATPHEIARALYLMGWQPPSMERFLSK